MTKRLLLFDASSIFALTREFRSKAIDMLLEGSTISLVHYELGNAVWRECFLLKKINQSEAEKLLQTMFALLHTMDVAVLEDETEGMAVLKDACELNLTYYDASYISEAIKTNRVLVTDDRKLAKAAEKAGLKTLTTEAFSRR